MGINPADVGLAVGGVAMDFANTAFANRLQTRAAHQAQDFSAQQYAHRYQTQVADLKAAGLNPMLAYMQSPGSAPSGVMAQQQKSNSIDSIIGTAQAAKLKSENEQVQLENKNLVTLQYKLTSELRYVGKQIEEIDEKIKNEKATNAEINARTELLKHQTELYRIQSALGGQQYNINRPEELASGTTSAQGAAHVSRTIRPVVDILDKILGGRQKYYNAIKP